MAETPNVRLNLSSRSENVLLVRQALTGVAEAIDLDPVTLNDISTAVSEAANNVVMHAYGGDEGPLQLEVYGSPAALRIVVRDYGNGIGLHIEDQDEPPSGIGLPVIQALAQRTELRNLAGEGLEVEMEFATAKGATLERPRAEDRREPGASAIEAELVDSVTMRIAPSALARTVLARVLCALAARTHFSTDLIDDTQALAEALVARAESSDHLNVGIGVAPRKLDLRVGPLGGGGPQGALVLDPIADEHLGPVLERLTGGTQQQASSDVASDTLALQLTAEQRR